MPDPRTANYDWEKPDPANNPRSTDVPRLQRTIDAADEKVRELETRIDGTDDGLGSLDARIGSFPTPVSLDLSQRPRPLTQFGEGLILDYDDTGATTGASTNWAIVQAAFDSGEPEIIIPRSIVIDAPIIHKYDQRIKGAGSDRSGFVGVGFGGSGYLLHVQPAPFSTPYKQHDKRMWGWENFGFKMHSGQCLIPMYIDTTLGTAQPSVFLNKPYMYKLVFDAGIGASGISFRHNNTGGQVNGGMFGADITHNWFGDGTSYLQTGDSNNIMKNIIAGTGIGVFMQPISGAAKNLIGFNNITSSGGSWYIAGGIQTEVFKNQCELKAAYTGPISGGAVGYIAAGATATEVVRNNMNGYANGVPIVDDGTLTQIDWNSIAYTGAGNPILTRGSRAFVGWNPSGTSNAAVTDTGSQTRGVTKTYTPVVTSGSGTITSATGSASYRITGNEVTVTGDISITTAGTGVGLLNFTLPITPANSTQGLARETAATGVSCSLTVTSATLAAGLARYDGTSVIADGRNVRFAVTYRIA